MDKIEKKIFFQIYSNIRNYHITSNNRTGRLFFDLPRKSRLLEILQEGVFIFQQPYLRKGMLIREGAIIIGFMVLQFLLLQLLSFFLNNLNFKLFILFKFN